MQFCEPLMKGAEAYWVLGDHLTLLATSEQTNGAYFAVLMQSPFRQTDGDWYYPHTHDVEQSYLVLEGRLAYELGGTSGFLHQGDRLVVPAGTVHRVWNAGPEVSRFIMMMSACNGEAFYRRFGRPVNITEPTPFPTFTKVEYHAFMEASRAWMLDQGSAFTSYSLPISAALPTWQSLFGGVSCGTPAPTSESDAKARPETQPVHPADLPQVAPSGPATFLERTELHCTTPGGFECVSMLGDDVTIIATGKETGGNLFVTEIVTSPSSHQCAPTHVHTRESQYYLVLSGEMIYKRTLPDGTVEDKEIGAGESVFFPAGMPHRIHNKAGVRARLLVVSSPSGLESVVRQASIPREVLFSDSILSPTLSGLELSKLIDRHNAVGGDQTESHLAS
jgi:mannose-6-phosphate isomerase-like protein (cupin superfamily)